MVPRKAAGCIFMAASLLLIVDAALTEVPVGLLGAGIPVLAGAFALGGWNLLRGRGYGALRGACDVALVTSVAALFGLVFGGGWGGLFGGFVAEAVSGMIGGIAAGALFVLVIVVSLWSRSLSVGPKRRDQQKKLKPIAFVADEVLSAPAVVQARTNSFGKSGFEKVGALGGEDLALSDTQPSFQISDAPVPTLNMAPVPISIPAARPSLLDSFVLPPTTLLHAVPPSEPISEEMLREEATALEGALSSYDVECKMESWVSGPTVSTFEGKVSAGTKFGKVVNLADDLGLALGRKVRVTAGSRPGRLAFEISRGKRSAVGLRELCESGEFLEARAALPVVLGRGMRGEAVVADIAEMPHAIVAGATGSGKSVALNTMLVSLLTRLGPDELRLVLVDPKVVELQPYARVPHMLVPVVTDMNKAMSALRWAVSEMELRYQVLAASGSKNLTSFNSKCKSDERLPHIVIVVDEFADFIATQGKAAEVLVSRLAQKARAAGIHMILATQRPSVDVITGTIKANFPTRIALRVAQKVDSRTILDEQGAEHLLGRGDMLVKLGGGEPIRVQCPMVSEQEVEAVCSMLAAQGGPRYDESVLAADAAGSEAGPKAENPNPSEGTKVRSSSKVWS